MKTMKPQKRALGILVIAVLAAVITPACWDDNDSPDTPRLDDAQPSRTMMIADTDRGKDEKFLNDAAELNRKEILLAELASDRAGMRDVKELAEMIVNDHTKSLSDLNGLARRESVVLESDQSDKAVNAHHKLSNKSADDFDECYIDMMIDGHNEAILMFENAARQCEDPEIREWADASLPDLRKHLEHAKFCEKKMREM